MLFVYYMLDAPDTAIRRTELRPAHRQYLAGENDRIFAAGPLWSDDGAAAAGSILVLDWPDKAAAAAWLQDEPFTKNGVYGYVTIKAYDNKWPKDGRPPVRRSLFAHFCLNDDMAAAPRKQYRPAHLDYLAATSDKLFAAGPLFDDSVTADLEDRAGSLYIVDVSDRSAADAWLADEPFNQNGVYGDVWTQAYENLWPQNAPADA